MGIQPSATELRHLPAGKAEGPEPTGAGAGPPQLGNSEAAPGVPRERAHAGKTLNLCSLFGACFPRPVSRTHRERAVRRRFSRGDLNTGSALRRQSGAKLEGVWGRGAPPSHIPKIPLGTRLWPSHGANTRHPATTSADPGKAPSRAGTATSSVLPPSNAGEGARPPDPLQLALLL